MTNLAIQVIAGLVVGMFLAWLGTRLAGRSMRVREREIAHLRAQMLAREIALLGRRLASNNPVDQASRSVDEELLMTRLLEYSMLEKDAERGKGVVVELESEKLSEPVEQVVQQAKGVLSERAKEEELATKL